ncbi:NAD kinase [Urechidicola croceus]|uniref:NAD kinase n=1 Tax=Urechidicola croceus TaxID=1850246 RepID=A0A1D8P7T3_9FLAO|nr:NAD kinase [Urechidicola croceus]AOW20639.1 NAD kinase [Urechidicola croceus]
MKIAIYGHYFNEDAKQYVEDLLNALDSKNANIYIEENFCKLIKSSLKIETDYNTFSNHKELNNSFDFMFTIGGDGTILRSITYIRDSNIPVIGVNIGRLGFLATVKKEQISEAIEALFNKDFKVEERVLLTVKTEPQIEELKDLNFALNEITLSRKDTASMITVETYLDEEYLTSYWADGLITSTPTGSTGYSLSCGGPVITPQAKSLVLTPVAPHNLNARPLIIPDKTKIKMKVSGRENEFFMSLDSRIATISNETDIYIEKAPFTIKMIELHKHSFIKTLRKKLLWGADTRN